MTRTVWCGVDLGSTNVKVVAVDRAGLVVARAQRPTPRVTDGEYVLSDTAGLVRVVEDLLVEACRGHLLAAVCVAGVGEDGVLVGPDNTPLDLVLPWFDPRRREVFPEVLSAVGPVGGAEPECRDRFGVVIDAARTITGWAWMRTHRSAAVEAAAAWIAVADYPAAVWTGRAAMSDTLAARTGAWDVAARHWAPERVEPFLGSVRRLPPVVRAGQVLGPLRSERLAAAGVLAPDAVVVAGGHDHPVAASVVDRQDPGAVLDSMGTAEVVVRTVQGAELPPGCDVSPAVLGAGRTAFTVVELDRNVTAARAHSSAVSAEIDRLLVVGISDAHAEKLDHAGLFTLGEAGGEPPSWSVDAPRYGSTELAAAVLVACARLGASAVTTVRGDAHAARVYGAGGWTASPGWMRLKSSALGGPYRVLAESQLTACGAAHLALLADGHHPDPLPLVT